MVPLPYNHTRINVYEKRTERCLHSALLSIPIWVFYVLFQHRTFMSGASCLMCTVTVSTRLFAGSTTRSGVSSASSISWKNCLARSGVDMPKYSVAGLLSPARRVKGRCLLSRKLIPPFYQNRESGFSYFRTKQGYHNLQHHSGKLQSGKGPERHFEDCSDS